MEKVASAVAKISLLLTIIILMVSGFYLIGCIQFSKPICCDSSQVMKEDMDAVDKHCFVDGRFCLPNQNGACFRDPDHGVGEKLYYPWVGVTLVIEGIILCIPICIWEKKMGGRDSKSGHNFATFLYEAINLANVMFLIFHTKYLLSDQYDFFMWKGTPLGAPIEIDVFPEWAACVIKFTDPIDLRLNFAVCDLPLNSTHTALYAFLCKWFFVPFITSVASTWCELLGILCASEEHQNFKDQLLLPKK